MNDNNDLTNKIGKTNIHHHQKHKQHNKHNANNHHRATKAHDDDKRYFNANQQQYHNDEIEDIDESIVPIVENYQAIQQNSPNNNNNNLIKYELDWYFLDKNGHMNIISLNPFASVV